MCFSQSLVIPAAWLAQLGEHRSAEREFVGSNPGWTNNQVRYDDAGCSDLRPCLS